MNTKAEEIIAGVEKSFRDHLAEVDNGVLKVKFMSMGRETELSPLFSSEENLRNLKPTLKKLLHDVGLETVAELREVMCDKGNKGSWLSGTVKFDCLTEEFSIEFDYDKRFNVLAENWEYDEDDDEVFPDRRTLLADFERCQRKTTRLPEWYEDLVQEQKEINDQIANANSEDVFYEQISVVPSLSAKFETVDDDPEWIAVWNEIGEVYEDVLLTDPDLIPLFVDDSRVADRAVYVFEELEPKVVNAFIEQNALENSPESRAYLLNALQISKDETPAYDCEWDERLDLELLEEDFEDVIISLVMSQTQQRFPDLEEVLH